MAIVENPRERAKVYVAELGPEVRELIPSEIEGYEVAIEVIGKIKPL